MGDFNGEISQNDEGKTVVKGEVEIWPAIVGGLAVVALLSGFLNNCGGTDGDSNTYRIEDLMIVEFSPGDGMDCQALGTRDEGEILPSTVTCP